MTSHINAAGTPVARRQRGTGLRTKSARRRAELRAQRHAARGATRRDDRERGA